MFLVGLSPVLKDDLFWLKFSGEKGQKAPFLQLPDSLRLGEESFA